MTRLFFDLNLDSTDALVYSLPPVVITTVLLSYTLLWSLRHLQRPALLFLGLLGGVTLFAFIGPDVILGGRRSSISRYFIPTYLSLQLTLSYFLSQKLVQQKPRGSTHHYNRPIWHISTISLILAGLISCTVSLSADTWWHKKNSHLNPEIARIVSQSPNALLVSSNNNVNFGEIISLSHLFKPDQQMLLFEEPGVPAIPENQGTIFLFNLSAQAREKLEQTKKHTVVPSYKEGRLWQLIPKQS